MRLRPILPAIALPAILGLSTPLAAQGDTVPGRILIELSDRKDAQAADRTAREVGARVERTLARGRYAVLALDPATPPARAARKAAAQPGIATAAPIGIRRLVATPNDPLFSPNQWALHNTGQTVTFPDPSNPDVNLVLQGLADADIDAPEAWDITTGSSSIVVAVIDSGFPVANADLNPNLWINTDEIAGDGIDNDFNGYIDDRNGFNFPAQSANMDDDHGHGSFCSGIIGARGNNGAGIAGVNWNVAIMGLKAFTSDGTATDAELVEAIDYAVDNGARVINASWGDWLYSPVVEGAIRRASDAGVLFVAATGNDRVNLKEQPFYPACYTLPNIVSVGATDIRDAWAIFSNYDDTLVDSHAPGYWVYSARPTKYEFGSGTSFAAPQVVGVAALLLAQDPAITTADLRARLIGGVDVRTSLDGRGSTSGRISAYKALASAGMDTIPPAAINDLAPDRIASNGFLLSFTAPGDDNGTGRATLYDARMDTQPIAPELFLETPRIHHLPTPGNGGAREQFLATGLLPDTTYYIRVRAMDDAGNMTPVSNEVVATTDSRTTFFQDDMENGAGKWTVSGAFALTNEASAGGDWCWTDSPGGNYTASTSTTITSTPIDLTAATDPWLSFQHQHIFDTSYTSAGDNGQVLVSTDGTNFQMLAQYVNFLSPFHLARVNLKEYAGQPTVYLRFRFRADFSTKVADGWHIDNIEVYEPAALLPEPAEIVMESRTRFGTVSAAPDYVETTGGGNWFSSVAKAALSETRTVGSRYNVTDVLGSTARYTPQLAVDGVYEVFVAWGDYANAANVRHVVYHADGAGEKLLTQDSRTNANKWHSLGTYRFARGRSADAGSVLVDDSTVTGKPNASAEGRVYADSVLFVYRGITFAAETNMWVVR